MLCNKGSSSERCNFKFNYSWINRSVTYYEEYDLTQSIIPTSKVTSVSLQSSRILASNYCNLRLNLWRNRNEARLENTLNYGLERVWAVGYTKGWRRIAIGYDEGTIMVKVGREEPVASIDNSEKIIWAKHNEIQTVNIFV